MDHAAASYQRSVSLGPQYPAALVRLGSLQSSQGHRDDGLKTLGEAERLYRIANDGEGEAEVLLRKAEVLDARGEYADARAALDRALALARTADSPSLVVRTNLRRSSVLLSEGKLAEAEQLAAATVQSALDGGLQAIAALGLIDLAGAMQQRGKMAEAEAQVRRAIDLASRQQALRTAARARIALASILSSQGRNEEVLSLLEPSIEYLQRNQYRSLELTASNIFARALQQSGKPDAARAVLEDVLANARRINDRRQEGLALTGLYSIAIASGALPAALDLRQQAETIHRAQSDMTQLPFDLTTRAELLINLGRFEEAGAALRELDEGVSKKLEPFVERQRRASYLRALAATLNRDSDAALRLLSSVTAGTDATGLMVKALREYAEVQARRSRPPAGEIGSLAVEPAASPAVQRELHYWRARAQLAAGTAEGAMASVKAGLALMAGAANDEVEWRLAAAGAAAARRLARADEQRELHDRALAIITRLRDKWRDGARLYEARPDLVELKTAAGL
jgi:tetratricopeptide (TPR) repeat protein